MDGGARKPSLSSIYQGRFGEHSHYALPLAGFQLKALYINIKSSYPVF